MPGARCTDCARTFELGITVCPFCGDKTWPGDGMTPDVGWREDLALKDVEVPEDETQEMRRVIAWRLEELRRAGYELRDAAVLAVRVRTGEEVDLHRAIDLIRGGCDPTVALDILL